MYFLIPAPRFHNYNDNQIPNYESVNDYQKSMVEYKFKW
jgi:hypothetical protein